MTAAWVGIGANKGDPERAVGAAIGSLMALGPVSASSLYRTEPQGPRGQPWFVNAVARVECGLGPHELLRHLQALERAAGRRPGGPRWGPRELDLDLLLFGSTLLESPELSLPHPRFHTRRFVLEPLVEIAPQLLDPRSGKRVVELLRDLDDPRRSERISADASRQAGGDGAGRRARPEVIGQ